MYRDSYSAGGGGEKLERELRIFLLGNFETNQIGYKYITHRYKKSKRTKNEEKSLQNISIF